MSEAWLEGPLTSTAYGWRLERRDGVTLGFTSHDHDVEIDGLLLRASPGMAPTSITESLGIETDGLDVRGSLSADAIRERDLQAGRWDCAKLSIFLFDWTQPNAGFRLLAAGELGSVSFSGAAFEAEFKGPGAKLDRAVAPYASPLCRAEFCDAACGLNIARFTHLAALVSATGSNLTVALAQPGPMPQLGFGRLRWLDGDNCGLWSDIVESDGANIMLAAPPPFTPQPGARIALVEGCDKILATCAVRFSNAINFRGEPHLPGNDILTRYPGAS
jgi:uncharacterized phage protein (TIGR02218 family)